MPNISFIYCLLVFVTDTINRNSNNKGYYDLLDYLPDTLETVKGQDILVDEHGMGAFSMVVVENMELKRCLKLEKKFEAVDHVKDVLWYDDIADLNVEIQMIPKNLEAFLKGCHDDDRTF